MHNILIVDDEERDIKMLAMLLEQTFTEEYQLFFATSPLEAFSEIKEFSPTLIFVDIKMPGMSGLEFLTLIKPNKNIYPIIVSAYSDFEYAKGAMLAEARDYLLKPVHTDEIRAALDKYFTWHYNLMQQRRKRESLSRQISNLTHMLEKDIISAVIYNQDYRDRVADYLNMTNITYNWGICLVLTISSDDNTNYSSLAGIRSDITRLVKEQQMQSISAFIRNNLIFFLFSRPDGKQQFLQRANDCVSKISSNIFTHLDPSPQLAMGEPFASNEGMQYSYRVCMSKLLNSSLPFQFSTTTQTHTSQHIVQSIRAHKYHEANAFLNRKLESLESSSSPLLSQEVAELLYEVSTMLFGHAEKSTEDYAEIIEHSSNYRRTAFELLCSMEDTYSRLNESRQQKLVTQMRQFIDEKYSKQLSLTGLSQKFNLNSYYISKLFKEYTNQTFVEYLTQVRVTKAVQLIAENRHSFKEIADLVGYNDPSYFSKVFKKITGKSPREYSEMTGVNLKE